MTLAWLDCSALLWKRASCAEFALPAPPGAKPVSASSANAPASSRNNAQAASGSGTIPDVGGATNAPNGANNAPDGANWKGQQPSRPGLEVLEVGDSWPLV